jgi:hypothetical protein
MEKAFKFAAIKIKFLNLKSNINFKKDSKLPLINNKKPISKSPALKINAIIILLILIDISF